MNRITMGGENRLAGGCGQATCVSLNGQWLLSFGQEDETAPTCPEALRRSGWTTLAATVPGNVELDLIAVGKLPELYVGNRIYGLATYETCRWWYHRRFATPTVPAGHRVGLRFDGLDCLGTIFLNDQVVGHTDNMLIGHEFDITDALKAAGDNELFVRIDSAVLAGRQRPHRPIEWAFPTNCEGLSIRKAPHVYGWDILPRLVSAGLWRSVSLEFKSPTRWIGVYWATLRTDAVARTADVMVDWDFTTESIDLNDLRLHAVLSRDAAVAYERTLPVFNLHGRISIHLGNVELWWPRGSGEPALYEAALELIDSSGNIVADHHTRIGLRTIELRRTPMTTPEAPGEFVFVINGEKIFMKGTNWVPLDALHSRDYKHLPTAIAMVLDLNCNMLRYWGGNVYEDHAFFDLCDENGILVWQDFAMACATYPQTDAFARDIQQEAVAIVCKLRNHASLAIWSGNNENDDVFLWGGNHADPNDDRLSRHVLPEVIRQFDFQRPYLPSSPYRSPELVRAGNRSEWLPEAHLWGARDDFKGQFYTTSLAHFVSEIGYHGCPCRASLEEMFDPECLWPWQDNDQWLTKATRPVPACTDYDHRIALMAKQTGFLFGEIPTAINDFVCASRLCLLIPTCP